MEIDGYQQLSAFGPGRRGSHFAIMTHDGRLQLWDTATGGLKREYKEQNHLSVTYTCLAWLTAPNNKDGESNRSRKKKRQKNNNSDTLGKILLGTENGRIIIWNLTTGKLVYDLNAYEHKEVSSISTSTDGRYFYSVSKGTKMLKRWDVETGASEKDMNINIGKNGAFDVDVDSSGDQIATGTTSLQLWDQTSKQRIGSFPGHTSSITSLKFTPDNKYVLSTAYNDRFPALWDCKDAKTEEELANGLHSDDCGNAQTFAMDAPSACCDLICSNNNNDDDNDNSSIYDILAVSENGVLNVWRWSSDSYVSHKNKKNKKKKKKKKKKHSVKPTSKSASSKTVGSPVFAAMFCTNEEDANKILVAHGDVTAPTFRRIQFVNSKDSTIFKEIMLDSKNASDNSAPNYNGNIGHDSSGNRNTSNNSNDHHANDGNSSRTHIASKGGDASASWPIDSSINGNDIDDVDGEEDDATLAQRVEALAKSMEADDDKNSDDEDNDKNILNARSAAARAAEIASTVEDDSLIPSGRTPRARSLVKILEQALKSSDGALLEHCLGTSDKTIIRETVEGLSATCVVQFLTRVISKFEARPARAANLCVWIKVIIEKHAGYLTSSQDAVTALSSLHFTVDGRLGVFKRLLKLSGRLDLILSQISTLQTNRMVGNRGEKRPRKVFVDKNMDDDEQEEDSEEDD